MTILKSLTWNEALLLLQEGFLVSRLPIAVLRFVDPPTTIVGPLIYLREQDYFEAWCERPHDRWRWRAFFNMDSSALGLFELPFKVRHDHVIGLEGLIEVPFEFRKEAFTVNRAFAPSKNGTQQDWAQIDRKLREQPKRPKRNVLPKVKDYVP